MKFLWASLRSYRETQYVSYPIEFCFLEYDSYIKGSPVVFNTEFGPFTDILEWMNLVNDSNRVFNMMDCATVVRI